MHLVSFLFAPERADRVCKLPLETSAEARLRVTAMFWDGGTAEHLFQVISEQPDGSERMVATETVMAVRDTGAFEVCFSIAPLEQLGWHRLLLRIDESECVATARIHVLGPSQSASCRGG